MSKLIQAVEAMKSKPTGNATIDCLISARNRTLNEVLAAITTHQDEQEAHIQEAIRFFQAILNAKNPATKDRIATAALATFAGYAKGHA